LKAVIEDVVNQIVEIEVSLMDLYYESGDKGLVFCISV